MWVRAVTSVLAAGLIAACSSSATPPEAASAASETVSFRASADSTKQLGVVRWDVASSSDRHSTFSGIGSDGSVVAKVDSTMYADAQGRHITMHYTSDESDIVIKVGGTNGYADFQLESSTDAKGLPAGFGLMMADLAAEPINPSSTLTTAAYSGAGLHLMSPIPLVKGCRYLDQCDGLAQTLNCGKATWGLTSCSVKGIAKPIGKGLKWVIGLVKAANTAKNDVTNVLDCPDNIGTFFQSCMASNPNGSEQTFGNGQCSPGKACDTDEPPETCHVGEDCHGGCQGDGKACTNNYGLPCTSDSERSTWCCSGVAQGNTCGRGTCVPEGGYDGGDGCCAYLLPDANNVCRKSS